MRGRVWPRNDRATNCPKLPAALQLRSQPRAVRFNADAGLSGVLYLSIDAAAAPGKHLGGRQVSGAIGSWRQSAAGDQFSWGMHRLTHICLNCNKWIEKW